MTIPFVDPGFVDIGFVDGTTFVFTPLTTHLTDFREYARGKLPGDWTERWATGGASIIEGAYCDLSHRSVLQLNGDATFPTRIALSWNAPEASTGPNDQETLSWIRPLTSSSNNFGAMPFVRGSGTVNAENCYRVILLDNNTWQLVRLLAGVGTVLSTQTLNIRSGGLYYVRLRAQGTTIRAKVWLYGDTEPASWVANGTTVASVTDTNLISGWLGFSLSAFSPARSEVLFFSAATNGDTAPPLSSLDPPLAIWIQEPDEELEMTARFEYYDPASDSVKEVWFSNIGRLTSPYDYPASTIMQPLLLDAGSRSSRLEADAQLGGADIPAPSAIRLRNLPLSPSSAGLLDSWPSLSFYGRPVETRLGRRWQVRPTPFSEGILTPHRRFEIVGSCIPSQEPDVTTSEVTVQLGPVDTMLKAKVPAYRNVGIATGVKSLSSAGYLLIPSSTSYNIGDFAIYLRLFIPTAGVPGTGFCSPSLRQVDSTHRQWHIALHNASHATIPNKLHFLAYDASANLIINFITSKPYNINRFINIIFAISSTLLRWYVIIDNMIVGTGALSAVPVIATAQPVSVIGDTSTGLIVCDHRIEKWSVEDDALARFAARRDADSLTVSMHRCDDGSLSTVTDWAPLANHGTLQGTDAVDRVWFPTYLGYSEIAGTPMPISGGVLYHAPTLPIDPVREVFRYNDRQKTAGAGLQGRAKGLLLTGGGVSYSEPAEGPGTLDIVGASDQPVTIGLIASPPTPEDSHIHVPSLLRDELISRGALTPQTCDQDSFSGLRQLLPMKGGFYYDDPPNVADFLSPLGSLGAYYSQDLYSRLVAGCLLPPLNPGPYGNEYLLEFLGIPNRGVTFSANSTFNLNDTLASSKPWFGLAAWIKVPRAWKDPSATLGTYFPTGMTIIDRVDGAAGYYLGIDGRDGSIVFGAPGVTGNTSGLHYLKYAYPFQANQSYFIFGAQDSNTRVIGVYSMSDPGVALISSTSELTTGGMTVASSAPLRIGHGPRGSFYGWIGYVLGSSSALVQSDFVDISAPDTFNIRTTRWAQSNVSATRWGQTRFLINLTEGKGDIAQEVKNGLSGIIEGVRWCPKQIFDFRSAAVPSMPGTRSPIPAWRLESQYRQNRKTLTGADIAAGVSAVDRIALGQPYLSNPMTQENVRVNYLNSRDVSISTPLFSAEDADSISRFLKARISAGRRFADAKDWDKRVLALGLTDEVLIYHPRFGMNVGKPARVVTLLSRLQDLRGDVGNWG